MLVALQGKNTQTCPMVESYTCCSMKKQYMEVVQNSKRLTS